MGLPFSRLSLFYIVEHRSYSSAVGRHYVFVEAVIIILILMSVQVCPALNAALENNHVFVFYKSPYTTASRSPPGAPKIGALKLGGAPSGMYRLLPRPFTTTT